MILSASTINTQSARNVSSFPYIFVATAIVVGLQLLAVYFAPLAKILDTVPPYNIDWLVIISSVIFPVIIVEMTKAFSRFRSAG